MAYEPRLPAGLPADLKIDTSSSAYKALVEVAERHKWSPEAFSDVLGVEARRHLASQPKPAAAAPAPAPKPAPARDWDKMSTREQFAHSLATRSDRGPHHG
jgi:hypothetical protein